MFYIILQALLFVSAGIIIGANLVMADVETGRVEPVQACKVVRRIGLVFIAISFVMLITFEIAKRS